MEYGLARVRHHASGFFAWWFGELKALLPPQLTRLLSPPVNELVLELIVRHLVLRHREGGTERELGAVQVEGVDPEAAKLTLRSLIADMDLRRVVVSLRLPPELALRRLVDLPAAAEENLRQVLAFEMDRLTPFSSDAVHYDVQVIDRNLENRRIRVELLVLPRAAVDPTVQLLHRLGLEPDAVALPRGAGAQAPWRLPLVGNGSGERRFVNRVSVALLALAGALLVAAVYTAFDRQRARAERLGREVEMARKEAEEGRLLQQQIEQLSAEGTFIVDKKRARPPVVQVLNELTRALPDETWLYRLRFINEELQTFGYSPNASAMIGHIENSALFSNAQFRAPVTRDQRAEAEQFHIAFQVAKKKAQ